MKPRKSWLIPAAIVVVALVVVGIKVRAAIDPSGAHLLVTVEAKKGVSAELRPEDVMLYESKDRVPVTDMVAQAGQPLELYIAVDETVGSFFGDRINDLKKFINAQPANTAIGIVYLRDGGVDIEQTPTTDHAAAAKKLRLPTPNVGTSPFESISELIKKWPPSAARHEIVLVSTGIEPFGYTDLSNPFLDQAIDAVQRAEVPVFAIYAHPPGHWGHTFWRTTWGEAYLSRIADESGGEGYNMVGISVVSYLPFLDDISQRLQHQYRVAFTPKPQPKAGFVPVRAMTEVPNIDLVSQDRIWIGEQ